MESIADQFKALSDPTRLRLLHLLAHGELCVCDLMETLALPQSTVSRHMALLRRAGWVVSRRSGKWIHYSLAEPDDPIRTRILEGLRQGLHELVQAREDHRRLCEYLAGKPPGKCT